MIQNPFTKYHFSDREVLMLTMIICITLMTGALMYWNAQQLDNLYSIFQSYKMALEKLIEYDDNPLWQEELKIVNKYFEDMRTTK